MKIFLSVALVVLFSGCNNSEKENTELKGIIVIESIITIEAKKGDKILYAASFTANANAQYTKEFSNDNSLYVRTDLQHVGERFGTYNPELEPELVFPEYTLINARVGYVMEKYEFSLFCKNLTNKQAVFGNIQSFAGNLPGRERYSSNRPMTIGVNLKLYF